MRFKNRTVSVLAALSSCLGHVSALAQAKAPCAEPVAVSDTKYAPGQVWSYHHRDSEPDATITILRVEALPKIGTVVHIRLDGIHLRNCSGGPSPDRIEHAPFVRAAIDQSVVRLLRSGPVPSFEEGYARWRHDCGGVYTIPVSEMVAVDEKTFNSGSACSM